MKILYHFLVAGILPGLVLQPEHLEHSYWVAGLQEEGEGGGQVTLCQDCTQ